MRQPPIKALTLLISVTALTGTISPAFSRTSPNTSHHKQLGGHRVVHRTHAPRYNGSGYAQPAAGPWFAAPPRNPPGDVCPGIGRAFDCKIWPPPMDQDPDRKTGGGDSG